MSFYKVTCIGCGCDDDHACIVFGPPFGRQPCMWVRIDRLAGVGVCSAPACAPHLARWDRNDRMLQGQLSLGGKS